MIEEEYKKRCTEKSDINEHLPTLRRLAEECEHITEFGMREGLSTAALLSARPKKVVSYDISPACDSTFDRLRKILPSEVVFEFVCADTTKAKIDATDMLFVDAYHSAANVRAEIENNEDMVSKFIVFHDTEIFGYNGMGGGPGILKPIEALVKTGRWEIAERYENNNGFIVLKRRRV